MKNELFEDVLIYFSKSLLGKENEEEILWDLAKNCISKLGFVDCVIYLIDNNNKRHMDPKAQKTIPFTTQLKLFWVKALLAMLHSRAYLKL